MISERGGGGGSGGSGEGGEGRRGHSLWLTMFVMAQRAGADHLFDHVVLADQSRRKEAADKLERDPGGRGRPLRDTHTGTTDTRPVSDVS